MENGFDCIYEALAIILFCMALSLVFSIFNSLNQMEREVKENLYHHHVIQSTVME